MDPVYAPLQLAGRPMTAAYKASATSPLVVPPHGPGGLLSDYGLDPVIFSAMASPRRGLEAMLPVRMSNFRNPRFGILTGQTAGSGEEPTEACAGGPRAGSLKICWQTWSFGRQTMNSRVVRIDDAGSLIDRSEFLDYRLVGNPWEGVPLPQAVSPQQAFKNRWAKAHLEAFTELERRYRGLIWTGNPDNTAGSSGYIEAYGLDQLVRTGYRHMGMAATPCPAADSAVNTALDGLVAQDNGAAYVREITETYRVRIKYLAEQLRVSLTGVFVMRYGLFRALTEIWPCVYATYRCRTAAPGDNATIFVTGQDAEKMTADMRARKYLLIDDEEVPVVIDDALPESLGLTGVTGRVAESDLYFLPLTVDGEQVLYTEYFNYRGPEGAQAIIDAMPNGAAHHAVSPDGRYLFHYLPPTYHCYEINITREKRYILRTPFLAAKWTGLRYRFTEHERAFDPNDPYYFVNGGTTSPDTPGYFYPPF